ncbi:FecR domain-containing protein [Bordetella genomosp. 12]|uniref:Iron dicitrate transport regulator FecR n=1 Tax=Bordetella genomosp. 12 TaxID=463035 RepID=A0A261VC28_9BORD|nr:FecR domain-containing protein [Bordetella genomosp. 12]OZI71649.1 iron dicitrate transport regulator FecR [Bordetella genomosp. 12]
MSDTARPPASPRPIDPGVMRQAAEWIAQLWSDDASEQDQRACERWRARHPDHEQAWQRLIAFEAKLGSVPPDAARLALHQPLANGRRRALRALSLGALVLGTGYVVHRSDTWQRATADHRTATGEIQALTLPDGTQIVLATDTALDVRYSGTERLLVLRAGEILVATAPDNHQPARPFRVSTRHGTVQALGTRFTVREDADAARVAVFEGAVEIRAGGPVVRVDAGQGTRFTQYAVDAPAPVSEQAAAWAQGVLIADNMRLDALLAELGRYRKGLLRCDPAVGGLRVSGVFSLRDTDRALHNLTRALPVDVIYRTRYWVSVRAAS